MGSFLGILRAAVVLTAVSLSSGCGSDVERRAGPGDRSYTFQVPDGWETVSPVAAFLSHEGGIRPVAIELSAPHDRIVTERRHAHGAFDLRVAEFADAVHRAATRLDGSATNLRPVRYAGVPGRQGAIAFTDRGTAMRARVTMLASGRGADVIVTCLSAKPRRAAVEKGCDRVLESLVLPASGS